MRIVTATAKQKNKNKKTNSIGVEPKDQNEDDNLDTVVNKHY